MIHLLVLILTAALRLVDAPTPAAGEAAGERAAVHAAARGDDVAAADLGATARRELESGRFFRASLLYDELLRIGRDTTPATVIAAARAAAGWNDWEGVERLLEGRAWLDQHPEGWALLGHARFSREQWSAARDALGRAVAAGSRMDARTAALARARLAHALGQLDEHTLALQQFDRARAELPQLDDWLQLFAALAAGRAGDVAAVDARLDAIDADLAREWGWRAGVQARTMRGDSAAAIDHAERAATAMQHPARKAEALFEAGSLREARNDRSGARAAYRAAIRASQGAGSARAAARAFSELGGLNPDDELLVGRTLIRHGDFERGSRLLRGYVRGGHGTPAARDALRLELGEALFRGRQYRDAEAVLLEIARSSDNRARAASAQFTAGRAQFRDGRQAQGRATFETVANRFPGEAAAAQALFFAADLLHDDEAYDRARALYRRAVETGRGDVEEVGLAAMRLVGIAWVDRDFAGVIRECDEYLRRFPNGRVAQQAMYWAARAHDALGDRDAARQRMEQVRGASPLSYYAALAADYLGRPFPDLQLAAGPPRQRGVAIDGGLERVDLLRSVGWLQAADYEIDRLRRSVQNDDARLHDLAEELNDHGITTTGISIGWELQRRHGWNQRILRIIYPFPYRALIVEEARRRSVDPFLAAGLIRQESMFHATAVSPAGAIGLMQVMPETGRAVARNIGIDRFATGMLRRPEVNVQIGMAFLADQMRNHSGRIDAVLAAYNAGPHRVERWRRFPEWHHGELFAERIPFAETRGYVKIVQTNARIYRALYAD
jgi:soluble lytic murein transglycosylase